jgi:hypothetical protein
MKRAGVKNKINEKAEEKREWKVKQITKIEMSEFARFCLHECKRNCYGGMKKAVLGSLH